MLLTLFAQLTYVNVQNHHDHEDTMFPSNLTQFVSQSGAIPIFLIRPP